MRVPHSPCTLVLALALAAGTAGAQVTASTFGPGDSFTPGPGYFISSGDGEFFSSVANPFVATLGGALSQVRVAAYSFGVVGDGVRVGVYRGTDMNSAVLLEEFTATPPAGTGTILSFTSVLAPQIVAGDAYFVAMIASTNEGIYVWNFNDQGITADMQFRGLPENGWSADASTAAAFDVTVRASAVPEPATVALLAGGLLVVGGVGTRRGRLARPRGA